MHVRTTDSHCKGPGLVSAALPPGQGLCGADSAAHGCCAAARQVRSLMCSAPRSLFRSALCCRCYSVLSLLLFAAPCAVLPASRPASRHASRLAGLPVPIAPGMPERRHTHGGHKPVGKTHHPEGKKNESEDRIELCQHN